MMPVSPVPISNARLAVILGFLACVGPFAIDMYLPALPVIAVELDAPVAAVQGTLIAYFLAFGVSQLVWGPVSDRIGRKAPLLIGLGIFVLGTLLCAVAPSIGWLIAARFVQGTRSPKEGGGLDESDRGPTWPATRAISQPVAGRPGEISWKIRIDNLSP